MEVLFLPFSCFSVEEIITDNFEQEEIKIKIIHLKYLDSYKIKIDEAIKEINNSEEIKDEIENGLMNDLGKDVKDLFKSNIKHEYEKYIENKAQIPINAKNPDKVKDFGQCKVCCIFEPKNQIKYHNYVSEDELIYNIEDKDIDKEGFVKIVGVKFYNENKDKISLIINNKEEKLCHKYKLNKGINKIKIIFKQELANLSYLFYECTSLSDISALSKWNVSKVTNLTGLFYGCTSLRSLWGLKNWDVRNVNHFSYLFYGCTSLKNINNLKFWDVSNGYFFSCMFSNCISLKNLEPLKNWDVGKGLYFNYMFSGCTALSDISALTNWNVSNGNYFDYLFNKCNSLKDINPLKNWDVGNGLNFSYCFNECISLSDVSVLNNWNVKKGNNFLYMFKDCPILSDKKSIWNYKTI